jgi:hypothetical protein
MVEYFELHGPDSQHLSATDTVEDANETRLCRATSGYSQHRSLRRVADLFLEVKHTRRDQWIISAFFEGMVMHTRLLEEFERRGFTGYRLRPATVRFRDGSLSHEYSQIVVSGWAGVAPPESGIELIEACGDCGYKRYSPLQHPEHLIDWSQWTGDDFFIVWPLPKYMMITRRVADVLAELKVKSYCLKDPRVSQQQYSFGYTVGALSDYVPEDLAIRYGGPLELECEAGCYPVVEERSSADTRPRFPSYSPAMSSAEEIAERIRTCESSERPAAIAALFALDDVQALADACLTLFQKSAVTPEEAAPHIPVLLKIWNSAYQVVKPLQRESASKEWLLDDDYPPSRGLGEVVLDILGYLPGEEVGRALQDGVNLIDPRLKTFAIVSLLRRGEIVNPDQIEKAAASLEMRMIFYRQLRSLDRQWLMPEEWAQPWMLAASDLCHWAAHPNELGAPPEEVEPMATFALAPSTEVYLFRFREYPKPWEAGEGWMAGIAGPIVDGVSQSSPWSSFKRWDSMTPQQHFMKLYYRDSNCGS